MRAQQAHLHDSDMVGNESRCRKWCQTPEKDLAPSDGQKQHPSIRVVRRHRPAETASYCWTFHARSSALQSRHEVYSNPRPLSTTANLLPIPFPIPLPLLAYRHVRVERSLLIGLHRAYGQKPDPKTRYVHESSSPGPTALDIATGDSLCLR